MALVPKRARSYAHHTGTTLPVASNRLVARGSWQPHPMYTCDKTQASSRVHCSLQPDPWPWSQKERGRTRTIQGPLSQWPATGWLHVGLGNPTPCTHVTRPRPAAGSIAASNLTHGPGPKKSEVVRAPYRDHSPSGQQQVGCTWVLATPPHVHM